MNFAFNNMEVWHGVEVRPGPRDPETRNPVPPAKYKSGTWDPPPPPHDTIAVRMVLRTGSL